MDGKKQIRLGSTEGDIEQECIDISIAFNPACSIYLIMLKGLEAVRGDLEAMNEAKSKIPVTDFTTHKQLAMEQEVAKLAFNNGKEFWLELKRVINELEKEPKKVIIHKPNWNGNSKT